MSLTFILLYCRFSSHLNYVVLYNVYDSSYVVCIWELDVVMLSDLRVRATHIAAICKEDDEKSMMLSFHLLSSLHFTLKNILVFSKLCLDVVRE